MVNSLKGILKLPPRKANQIIQQAIIHGKATSVAGKATAKPQDNIRTKPVVRRSGRGK